jgi:lysozyme
MLGIRYLKKERKMDDGYEELGLDWSTRQTLIKEIKRDEGVKTHPYKCSAGKLTIGVGRNIEDNGLNESEIEYLLMNDLRSCVHDLRSNFRFYDALDNVRKRVMINMVFNLGINRLLKFKNFLAALEAGDYEKASVEMMDSLWARQVHGRADRLSALMRYGEEHTN